MKRWIIIAGLAIAVVALLAERFGHENSTVTETGVRDTRTIDIADVIEYTEMSATTFRVRTTIDVIPGNLSAAMVPALVVWEESDFSPGGEITIRNVNHGGNPLSGVTVLRTAVVRPEKIARAEFIMVPLGGPEAVAHAQIRFVFDEDGAELIGGDPATVGEADALRDLVLSWEAWRPPGVDFHIIRGMDPVNYRLSMRAYSGPQRFLEDALMERDWTTYTLKLPGGRNAWPELLKVALAMGDGAARHVISQILEKAENEWAADGPGTDAQGGDALALWHEIGEKLATARRPGDERIDMAGKTGYQTMLRSCATMALYMVDVTVARLIEAGHPPEGMRPTQTPEIGGEPEWMTGLAESNVAGLFLRAPQTIAFVLANPTSIPGRIPPALDDAGLLVHDDGKLRRQRYSLKDMTPWGRRWELLIR
jgi:hypothetical protein